MTTCSRVGDVEQSADAVNGNIIVVQIVATCSSKKNLFFLVLPTNNDNLHLKRRGEII